MCAALLIPRAPLPILTNFIISPSLYFAMPSSFLIRLIILINASFAFFHQRITYIPNFQYFHPTGLLDFSTPAKNFEIALPF
jgi:hypothetical protein